MRDGRERKIRSSSFFYQNMATHWRAESKNMNKSPCSFRCVSVAWRPCSSGDITIAYYMECIVVYSSATRDYTIVRFKNTKLRERKKHIFAQGTLLNKHQRRKMSLQGSTSQEETKRNKQRDHLRFAELHRLISLVGLSIG